MTLLTAETIPTRIIERFERLAQDQQVGECWEWQLQRNPLGYGMIGWRDNGQPRATHAHRISAVVFKGARLNGHQPEVHHTCGNKACWNPHHLECLEPIAHAAEHKADRTMCKAGLHPWPACRYWYQGGWRCRPCRQEMSRRRYARLKARRQAANVPAGEDGDVAKAQPRAGLTASRWPGGHATDDRVTSHRARSGAGR